MDINEKAKAYDATLKAAKQWIKDGCTDKEKICLECCIAELRESEDERIRKALIQYLKDYPVNLPNGLYSRYDFFAYLEKQKDAKAEIEKAYQNADLVQRRKGFEEGVASVKAAEWSEKHIADVFEKVGLSKIVREQGNDELTNAVQSAMIELSKGNSNEWSEEDEDKLEQCIRIVSGWEGDYDIVKSPYSNFLKSLRPQPKWKPSEEQMEEFFKAQPVTCMSQELAMYNSLYNHEEKANSPKSHRNASNSSPD